MKKRLLILVASVMLVLAGCGSKPTLTEWVNSDTIAAYEEEINSNGGGVHAEFTAEGEDILVFSCIYDQQQDFSGYDMDAIFSAQLEALRSELSEMFTACEGEISGELSCIRIKYVNADGTVIYSYDYTK